MLKFCKMHSLGNDFMVVDAIRQKIDVKHIPISLLADRHRGIGFDQLLLVTQSSSADFGCRIFNADGSEAEQCGNGMRCIARFLQDESLTQKKKIMLETVSGFVEVVVHDNNHIQVMMGAPCFEPAVIPFIAEKKSAHYLISPSPDSSSLPFHVLSMGNPHAILRVPDVKTAAVSDIGSKMAVHSAFPNGINIGFMEVVNPQHIRLRTFERGAGETFACGSNACAAVVAGILHHELEHKVTVELVYGNLLIEWAGGDSSVILCGPATSVFSGVFSIT